MEGLLFPCPTLIANSLSEISVFIHLHIRSQTLIKAFVHFFGMAMGLAGSIGGRGKI
jgi:hypothetical protein